MHGGTIYKQNNTYFAFSFHSSVALLSWCLLASMSLKDKSLGHVLQRHLLYENIEGFCFSKFFQIDFPTFSPSALTKKATVTLCFDFFPRFVFFPFLTTPLLGEYFKETTALVHVPNVLTIIRSTQFFDSFHPWLNCCFRHTQRLSRYLFLSNTIV